MQDENHYLQLPARRLEFGGQRNRIEDSLVDYVIGLESLLSKPDENAEIRYRMSVRGSVLLSPNANERPEKFKEIKRIYDLRSAIVHGGNPNSSELLTAKTQAEEALRKCWHWYFNNWYQENKSTKAIDEIDKLLFLRN